MATYQFKLPDIGEGIAEAEIVAWHVKVGDKVEEDQQLADMMTDKATVEMESPVAGTVTKLAGEVGDQIAIGSVLVEIETAEGAGRAAAESTEEQPLADGAVEPTEAQAEGDPGDGDRRRGDRAQGPVPRAEPRPEPETEAATRAQVLASRRPPAARDLGIDLAQVKTSSDRVRHADLDAYLLYNGGTVASRGTASAPTKHQGRRPAPQDRREYAGGEAPNPAFRLGRGI